GRERTAHWDCGGPEIGGERTLHDSPQHRARSQDGRCSVQLENHRALPLLWTAGLKNTGAASVQRQVGWTGQEACPTQALTTVAFLRKSGSNSTPMPWPVGTGMTPFLISKLGVYQDSFLAAARETYSIHGPMFGVVAANCRMLTLAAPVCVFAGRSTGWPGAP